MDDIITKENIIIEKFELIKLFGNISIMTNKRIDQECIPYNWHYVELQKDDNPFADPVNISRHVDIGFCGSILSPKQIRFQRDKPIRSLGDPSKMSYGLHRLGKKLYINQFCELSGIQLKDYYWNSIL